MAISVVLLKPWGEEPRKDGSVVYCEAGSSPHLGPSDLLMSNREVVPSRAHIIISVCTEQDCMVDTRSLGHGWALATQRLQPTCSRSCFINSATGRL